MTQDTVKPPDINPHNKIEQLAVPDSEACRFEVLHELLRQVLRKELLLDIEVLIKAQERLLGTAKQRLCEQKVLLDKVLAIPDTNSLIALLSEPFVQKITISTDSESKLIRFILSSLAGIPLSSLQNIKSLNDSQLDSVVSATKELAKWEIYIEDLSTGKIFRLGKKEVS